MPFLLSNWKYVLIGLLVLANILFYRLWQNKVEEFIAFQAQVAAIGKAAEAEARSREAEQNANLVRIKETYEKDLIEVRAAALANYLTAHRVPRPNPSGSQMPGITFGKPANDGTPQECVPPESFVQDSADDANKLLEWQDWARLNKIPLEN